MKQLRGETIPAIPTNNDVMTDTVQLQDESETLRDLCVMAARSSFLAFMQFVWWMPEPFKVGRHTADTCELLTKAVFDYLEGKSTFLVVNIPFRHGKTDMVSRAFPPWFLGMCAEHQPDVMLTGYGANLAADFSVAAKRIISTTEYQLVFPGVSIDPNRDAKEKWGIAQSAGTVTCTGLGGALTGKGYALGVVDDYCKTREEAFSTVYRERMWNSFSVDFMTRRAPVSITIVCATPWHPDDVTGRIFRRMNEDPEFPKFRHVVFPARKEGPGGYDYLFPERFSPEWYSSQRATLGANMSAALLDCNPVGLGTRMFKAQLQRLTTMPDRRKLNVYILVDSANAKRKSNDYTTMWVIGYGADRNRYALDCIRDKMDLKERTEALFALVEKWMPSMVFWEQVGAMSDTQHVKHVQEERGFHFAVADICQRVAKEDRIAWLIPHFEQHRLWFPDRIMYRCVDGTTRDLVMDFETDEYEVYPAARHDDMLDALANIEHPDVLPRVHFPVTRGEGSENARTEPWSPFH